MGVDIASIDPRNSGRETGVIVSPKLALSRRASDGLELYANAGRGFHSNDARGATARFSPDDAGIDPVDLLIPVTGGELGVRWEQPGLTASLAVWALRLKSELVYTGDAGDTESTDASRRLGVEALVNWSPAPGLNFDASAAMTRARYIDAPGASRIPNALENVVTGGATMAEDWRVSANEEADDDQSHAVERQ
jgi:outer membrane receptor protein involved in Fe transport